MIGMYCRGHHNGVDPLHSERSGGVVPKQKKEGVKGLCPECAELAEYCDARVDHCPMGERKSSCRLCPTHCYDPRHREAIRAVMRYAGPRMMLSHPLMAIRHLYYETFK